MQDLDLTHHSDEAALQILEGNDLVEYICDMCLTAHRYGYNVYSTPHQDILVRHSLVALVSGQLV